MQDRYRTIYLQVNSQATGTKLKEWARKHVTHANLAVARFDTLAEDIESEADKALGDLQSGAKTNLQE